MLHPDSKVMQGATSAADAVLVNLLLVVCCLPVVTGGAALAAAHGVMTEAARDESTTILRSFVGHMRRVWRQATLGWLLLLVTGVLLIWEYWALGRMDGWGAVTSQAAVITGAALVGMWALWFFPLTLRGLGFVDSARKAALLGIRHLPRSLAAAAVVLSPTILLMVNPSVWAAWLAFMVIIGPTLVIYLVVLLQLPVLDRISLDSESTIR